MPNTKTGHIHWGSWDFDYDVSGFEGLTLLNGTYRGRTAIGKFSMPAMRVKYLVDGGPLDWRRALGKGAGPYADRIRWKLDGDYGLQRIRNRNDEYVGFSTYILEGTQWISLSVYARIGAYHISQQWHLSEDGWILPRVWSKGLTINMDHWHHPYWRLDFDIDGPDSNSVYVHNSGSWTEYRREVNDTKDPDPRSDTYWYIRNGKTGQGAWVIPGRDDGHADEFSRLDVGVRRFVDREETAPWAYAPGLQPGISWFGGIPGLGVPIPVIRHNWDWQFDTGELGFLNDEDVSNTDVVLWYVAHMYHHAHEGDDHWGGAGPYIKLDFDAPAPQHQRDFGILVDVERNQIGNETTVRGRGYTPGASVVVTFQGIPNRGNITRYETADAQGRFTLTEPFRFSSTDHDDAFGTVHIYGFDVASGLMDTWSGSAGPWVA